MNKDWIHRHIRKLIFIIMGIPILSIGFVFHLENRYIFGFILLGIVFFMIGVFYDLYFNELYAELDYFIENAIKGKYIVVPAKILKRYTIYDKQNMLNKEFPLKLKGKYLITKLEDGYEDCNFLFERWKQYDTKIQCKMISNSPMKHCYDKLLKILKDNPSHYLY